MVRLRFVTGMRSIVSLRSECREEFHVLVS
jgi:hypothetical protein